VTAPFTGQQVVNNVIYSTNAGPSKGAYSTKVQPKSVYKAVKRKLKSGEKKVNLAEIALANNYLSGDLNLKLEYGENQNSQAATGHKGSANFSGNISGILPPKNEDQSCNTTTIRQPQPAPLTQLSGAMHSRNQHFNTEASQSSLGPVLKDPRMINSINGGQHASKSRIEVSRNKANTICKNSKTYNPQYYQNTQRDSILPSHPAPCQITQNININLIQPPVGLNDASSSMLGQNPAFFPQPPQHGASQGKGGIPQIMFPPKHAPGVGNPNFQVQQSSNTVKRYLSKTKKRKNNYTDKSLSNPRNGASHHQNNSNMLSVQLKDEYYQRLKESLQTHHNLPGQVAFTKSSRQGKIINN
jgi:hypothetical protein